MHKLLGQMKAQGRLQVVRRKVETLDGKQTTIPHTQPGRPRLGGAASSHCPQ